MMGSDPITDPIMQVRLAIPKKDKTMFALSALSTPPSTLLMYDSANHLILTPSVRHQLETIDNAAKALLKYLAEGSRFGRYPKKEIEEGIANARLLNFPEVASEGPVPLFDFDHGLKLYLSRLADRSLVVLNYKDPPARPFAVIASAIVCMAAFFFSFISLVLGNPIGVPLIWLVATVVVYKAILGPHNHDMINQQAQQLSAQAAKLKDTYWS